MLNQARKAEIAKQYGGSEANTGLPEVQIALLTEHISLLAGHLETHKKDFHSRRGLMQMVSNRKKLLNYLMKNDIRRCRTIISALSIRK